MSDGYQITEEELRHEWDRVDRQCLEWMGDEDLWDDWLPLMEEFVSILEDAYRKSCQLFESSDQFKSEPILRKIRELLISAMAELEAAKDWRS